MKRVLEKCGGIFGVRSLAQQRKHRVLSGKPATCRLRPGPGALQQKYYVDRAIEYAVNTPEQFARFIVEDRKSAARIFKESGQQPQ